MIQSIAAAAEQQSAASEQISRSISAISDISSEAEKGAAQAADAVTGLSERSSQLQILISRFKVGGTASGASAKWERKLNDATRILLVDDDPSILRLIQQFVGDYGQCTVAGGGQEGVAAFRGLLDQGKVFDAVCMDIDMSDMDGREALREIRSLEKSYGVSRQQRSKVAMVTGLDTPSDRLQAVSADCDKYITKPIDRDNFVAAIESFGLRKTEAQQAA